MSEQEEHMRFPVHVACTFMRAVGLDPVYSVIERRGKVYRMWANRDSHRKIISCARLEQMSLEEFVVWLRGRYPYALMLFPNPSVYRAREECAGKEKES